MIRNVVSATGTFQVGVSYGVRSHDDEYFEFEIVGRTPKVVTFRYYDLLKRAKVSLTLEGNEYVWPFGRYSGAPMLIADQHSLDLANLDWGQR